MSDEDKDKIQNDWLFDKPHLDMGFNEATNDQAVAEIRRLRAVDVARNSTAPGVIHRPSRHLPSKSKK